MTIERDLESTVHEVQVTGVAMRLSDVVIVPAEEYDRLVSTPETHAAELARLRDEHAEHLRKIEHVECVSTAFHKRVIVELRAKVGAK